MHTQQPSTHLKLSRGLSFSLVAGVVLAFETHFRRIAAFRTWDTVAYITTPMEHQHRFLLLLVMMVQVMIQIHSPHSHKHDRGEKWSERASK